MTRMRASRWLTAGVAGYLLALTACGDGDDSGNPDEEIEVTSSATPTAEPEETDPIVVDPPRTHDRIEDEGMGVTWTLQQPTAGPNGGVIITVRIRNDNEEPLHPDSLDEPSLEVGGESVDRLPAEDAGTVNQDGLDLPLGAGAATNLRFPYDTTVGALSDAEFSIGNVVYRGNLN